MKTKNRILANRVAELENLLVQSKTESKSEQTNCLVNLLDQSATSQFVNSFDQVDPTSPTQIFNFSPNWSSSQRSFDDESKTNQKTNVERRHSRRTSQKSENAELEMEDPLQSPTLTASLAYLEERDLIPPNPSQSSRKFHFLSEKRFVETDRAFNVVLPKRSILSKRFATENKRIKVMITRSHLSYELYGFHKTLLRENNSTLLFCR